MPRRLVNLALLGAIPLLAGTGLVAWILPEPDSAAPLFVHRLSGVALILSLAWKYGIAERSVRRRATVGRRDASLVVGAAASAALLLVLGLGLAWTAGVISFNRPFGYSLLNIHVFIGVALVPLVIAHAAQRWERRPPVTRLAGRRVALRVLALGAASLVLTAALDRVALARRMTGSRHAGSYTGNGLPLTIWNFDTPPSLDAATWRLDVAGAVERPVSLTYAELLGLPSEERDALLDCTGGWWSAQAWRGVTLAGLLASRGASARARAIDVISITGHRWSFPVAEAGDLLLATHVGGEVLSPGHGWPARLVAPGRRGFQWIKWVSRVEVH